MWSNILLFHTLAYSFGITGTPLPSMNSSGGVVRVILTFRVRITLKTGYSFFSKFVWRDESEQKCSVSSLTPLTWKALRLIDFNLAPTDRWKLSIASLPALSAFSGSLRSPSMNLERTTGSHQSWWEWIFPGHKNWRVVVVIVVTLDLIFDLIHRQNFKLKFESTKRFEIVLLLLLLWRLTFGFEQCDHR